jgi:hypothetical protein
VRTNYLRILLLVIGLALLTVLVFSLTRNTHLSVDAEGGGGGTLTVETTLPNATCQKVLTTTFPFVKIRCQEAQLE